MLPALSRAHQAGEYVLARQLIKVKEDFLKRHPRRTQTRHVTHRDARTAYAGFVKAFFWTNRDSGDEGIHARIVNL